MTETAGVLDSVDQKSDVEFVLEVKGLNVDFGVGSDWVPAIKNVDFAIRPGEILALVGESGSGKSTSAMTILDLLPRNVRVSGSVKLRGQEIRGLSSAAMRRLRGEKVAAIFQEPMTALNPVITVGAQIIEMIRAHRSLTPREAGVRALELLALVEIPDPPKAFASYPHQLSGGQRQRAMIAQALACDPDLLIADEPTTALDVTVQAEILELLRDLRDRLGSAVLLITHDMGVVADLADSIVVMRDGEVVETGKSMQIFRDPQHPYTQQLLAAVPQLGVVGTATDAESVAAALVSAEGHHPIAAIEVSARGMQVETVATDDDAIMALNNVVVEFGKRRRVKAFRAVNEVSLQIRPGEVLGLVGESGSGKSTIGRVAVGLQPVVSGSVSVAGLDITTPDRRTLQKVRRNVGMVFQDPSSSLNPRLSIADSIGEPLFMGKEARGEALRARVYELLDAVSLPRSYAERYPHQLSGGQKQRVGIARALALRPQLLVADEPTSALDVSVQTVVLDLLKDLQRDMNFACLFISHDLAVVDMMADRVAVMYRGSIVETGDVETVLRAPTHAYTQRLIAAIPYPDPEIQNERRLLRRGAIAAEAQSIK